MIPARMVMLSTLLRCQVVDAAHRHARLIDASIDPAAGDHPPVTWLYLRREGPDLVQLPWDVVENVDWDGQRIRVDSLDAAAPVPDEALAHAVLLKRDIRDALVLDLARREATVANDLWLDDAAGKLLLAGADVGAWAVLRRFARERLGRGRGRGLVDWMQIEFLRGDPRAAIHAGDRHAHITRLPPGDIAQLVDAIPYLHAAELLSLLPEAIAADVLEVLGPERQRQVFEEFDDTRARMVLTLMAPDAAADLVAGLELDRVRRLLEHLPAETRRRLVELLRYPADTAGGLMTNDMPIIPVDGTIGMARRELVEPLRRPDFIYYIYVVDDLAQRRLQGVLTLRDLITAGDDRPVSTVMQRQLVTVDPLEPARVAAQRVADTQLDALPVVGGDHRLLGVITVDAAVAQIAPAAWRRQAPRVFS